MPTFTIDKGIRRITAAILICLLWIPFTLAAGKNPVKPTSKDKCPVCGMFIHKYPDWLGEIIFGDGSVAFFDGSKDLFKYYFNIKRYNPKKTMAHIEAIFVTEYYDMRLIDARKALFVIGSDVYGPMGRELIPFLTEPDAREFMKDHRGRGILRFEEISPRVIEKLD